jgi:hypothetical protein
MRSKLMAGEPAAADLGKAVFLSGSTGPI